MIDYTWQTLGPNPCPDCIELSGYQWRLSESETMLVHPVYGLVWDLLGGSHMHGGGGWNCHCTLDAEVNIVDGNGEILNISELGEARNSIAGINRELRSFVSLSKDLATGNVDVSTLLSGLRTGRFALDKLGLGGGLLGPMTAITGGIIAYQITTQLVSQYNERFTRPETLSEQLMKRETDRERFKAWFPGK